MRIVLDTTATDWTATWSATWSAKRVADSSYTVVRTAGLEAGASHKKHAIKNNVT